MKRSTQQAELKTQVKHNTLHKVTALGGKGSKLVANQTIKTELAHHVGENNPFEKIEVKEVRTASVKVDFL